MKTEHMDWSFELFKTNKVPVFSSTRAIFAKK